MYQWNGGDWDDNGPNAGQVAKQVSETPNLDRLRAWVSDQQSASQPTSDTRQTEQNALSSALQRLSESGGLTTRAADAHNDVAARYQQGHAELLERMRRHRIASERRKSQLVDPMSLDQHLGPYSPRLR